MCIGGGGGKYTNWAPVAGGYGQTQYEEGGKKKYYLYDDKNKDITKSFKIDNKQVASKETTSYDPETGSSDVSTSYLYKRKA